MRVTSTEIQNNFGKYIQLAETRKIYIDRKGSGSVFRLEKVDRKEMLEEILESLYGCLDGTGLEDTDLDEARYARITQKHGEVTNDEDIAGHQCGSGFIADQTTVCHGSKKTDAKSDSR